MEAVKQPMQRRKLSVALKLSLSALAAALFIGFFRWTLIEYLTVFLEPPLEIGVGLLFVVSLIWSVLYVIRKRQLGLAMASAPLVINVATVLIVVLVPFTPLTISLNFRFYLGIRTKVVNDVLAGKYENRVRNAGVRGDLIPLTDTVPSLSSAGGEVVRLRRAHGTLVLFFDYRGILDSFSGFVYSSDDAPPAADDFGGNFFEIERLRKNWFWVSSKN